MAIKTKMITGARAATINCGRYLPKKDSSFSIPSANESQYVTGAGLVEIAGSQRHRMVVEAFS